MAKYRKKIDTSSRQRSLFDILVEQSHVNRGQNDTITNTELRGHDPDSNSRIGSSPRNSSPEGAAKVGDGLRVALGAAIKGCSLSRWEIAGKMSHLLGCEVSKFQIDSWTAESKDGHRIPAEYLPAFCLVTEDNGPLRMLAEVAGLFALPGPDALRSELRRLEEESRRINQERRKRELFLKEMEK